MQFDFRNPYPTTRIPVFAPRLVSKSAGARLNPTQQSAARMIASPATRPSICTGVQ